MQHSIELLDIKKIIVNLYIIHIMAKKRKVVTKGSRPTLPINVPFCLNLNFLDKVVDILCDPKDGIFDNTQNDLKLIYDDMRTNINNPHHPNPSYPLPNVLQSSVNTSLLVDPSGNLTAGHDLPVWLNDPCTAECRILVLSQDPKRRGPQIPPITISSPFGLHYLRWRSNLTRGIIPYAFVELIEELKADKDIDICVYFTDIYKLRKTEPSDLDINNVCRYKEILCQEIRNFNPHIVVLLGNEAASAFYIMSCCCNHHPNARYKNGKWGSIVIPDAKPRTKIDKIKEIIKNAIK